LTQAKLEQALEAHVSEPFVFVLPGAAWAWLLAQPACHRTQSEAAQSDPDKSFAVATADDSLSCSFGSKQL
jgi:hypothetical protein